MFTPVEMAVGCANQSVLLEPASARTRCLMATALLVKGELGAARRELDLAMRFNSDSLAYREVIGWLMALTGDWDQGLALMRSDARSQSLLPALRESWFLGRCHAPRRFRGGVCVALDYRDPNFFWRELMLPSSLGQLGRTEDAHASAAELLRAKPQFAHRGRRLIGHYIKTDELRATIFQGLNKAGVAIV